MQGVEVQAVGLGQAAQGGQQPGQRWSVSADLQLVFDGVDDSRQGSGLIARMAIDGACTWANQRKADAGSGGQ